MKFVKSNQTKLFSDLKAESNRYFIENNTSRFGNMSIYIKGFLVLAVYLTAYYHILFKIESILGFVIAYLLMGFSGVMIVFNLVHDASHHALSKYKWINKSITYLGDFVGINTYIWDIRHNIQHHSYTNILGGDLIIENIPMIRMSPHQNYKSFHRFQVYYAPVLYMLYSFFWMFVIDFKLFFKKEICNLKNLKHPPKEWAILICSKIFYVFYSLILPCWITDLTLLQSIGFFFLMHAAAGLLLSFVAVLGHFVEGTSFPDVPDGKIDNSWCKHELEATIDFAPKSKLVNWITGGLNTHVAHHIFPQVSHVHYYNLTIIIEEYCKANNLDYKKDTLAGGFRSHFRYLKRLSRP